MKLSASEIEEFSEKVWKYYCQNGRHDLPWRQPERGDEFDPYKILVSEIMLQQTQVQRVLVKYPRFLELFPDIQTLAAAELGEVLKAWQGLGYNRRAKYLWLASKDIIKLGTFPNTLNSLVALPGVGKNTAGAILAYAFNIPAMFIETNIRTVYIYHFTRDEQIVSDDFIWDLLGQTLDYIAAESKERPEQESPSLRGLGEETSGLLHPREFYWALMDYGTYLKTQAKNNSQSKHYKKQSKFEGSRRQLRGRVLRELASSVAGHMELKNSIEDERLEEVLADLEKEGLIQKSENNYRLA